MADSETTSIVRRTHRRGQIIMGKGQLFKIERNFDLFHDSFFVEKSYDMGDAIRLVGTSNQFDEVSEYTIPQYYPQFNGNQITFIQLHRPAEAA